MGKQQLGGIEGQILGSRHMITSPWKAKSQFFRLYVAAGPGVRCQHVLNPFVQL
jgi:hypothetical protein